MMIVGYVLHVLIKAHFGTTFIYFKFEKNYYRIMMIV